MLLSALSFTLGIFSAISNRHSLLLLSLSVILVLLILIRVVVGYRAIRGFLINYVWFMLGCLDVSGHIAVSERWSLPTSSIGKNRVVQGKISSLPVTRGYLTHFTFDLACLQQQAVHAKIGLTWYGAHPKLRLGDRWRLTVRLKPAHGLQNFGTLPVRYRLWRSGVRAYGYVVSDRIAQRLTASSRVGPLRLMRWRQAVADLLAAQTWPLKGVLQALTLGDKSLIDGAAWRVLRNTGTSHLVAISGLHLGLVAAGIGFMVYCLWRLSSRLLFYCPASYVATFAASVVALIYSALTGFSVPTQRACVMLLAISVAHVLKLYVPLWRRLLMAYMAVLLWQPLAIFSASFALSFLATAWLVYGANLLVCQFARWRRWLWLQVMLFFGLLPASLFYFQQISLVSPLANLVAIPCITLVILPLCLIAMLLSIFTHNGAVYLFGIAHFLLQSLWHYLHFLSNVHYAVFIHALTSKYQMLFILVGTLILLMPRGFPGKYWGACWLLPLFFYARPSQPTGSVTLTVLDSGQALSTVITTSHHVLVYDTGAKTPDFDSGQRILLPYLHYRHIQKVDMLMISHGDNDHIGGSDSLLRAMPVSQILTSIPQKLKAYGAHHCVSGQRWQWDGVMFRVLSPPAKQHYEGNNSSCVLKITGADGHSILLTGDIEYPAEQWLLHHYSRLRLHASVLLVPHHGSNTSSSASFIQVVQPIYALISVGLYNRYHLPHPKVLARYTAKRSHILLTSHTGAIQVQLGASTHIQVMTYRDS